MSRWLSPSVGFGLVAALYVLSFPYHPGLRSPNELCRAWQSRALVDHGTISINQTLMQYGMVGDLSCVQEGELNGVKTFNRCFTDDGRPVPGPKLYYPSKAPLVAMLGAPVYWVLKKFQSPVPELAQIYFGRLFVVVLPSLGLLVLLRKFLRALVPGDTADVVVIAYALGSMAFSYSEAFMSHQLSAVLLFSSFFAAWKVERGEWKWWGFLLSGAAAGAAVLNEYTGALGVVCVASYVVAARWKKWNALGQAAGLVVLGAAPFLAVVMAYHASAFGSPIASGYKFLNDPGYQHWHVGGFLGIKTPTWNAFWLSLFSPLRGLFSLSPMLLAAFWGVRELKVKDRALWVCFVVTVIAHAYFTSSFDYSSWGWTTGPRHLTGVLPFFLLPMALALESLKARKNVLVLSVIAGLFVSSMVLEQLIVAVNYVPDDVTTAAFGLTTPLLSQGFTPISLLALIIPNPTAGWLMLAMGIVAAAWVGWRFQRDAAIALIPMLMVVSAHLFVLKQFSPGANDVGGQNLMRQVWLLQPPSSNLKLF